MRVRALIENPRGTAEKLQGWITDNQCVRPSAEREKYLAAMLIDLDKHNTNVTKIYKAVDKIITGQAFNDDALPQFISALDKEAKVHEHLFKLLARFQIFPRAKAASSGRKRKAEARVGMDK